ncbi:hypothetical protein MBAV_001391 [Candidatus Magnetobacterium bavaricum]|uniref:Uncharacterized protein n=1 Tax=Candidatus Magnetobacterium bavaricum TaxID=29290 RepID=A0A0F3GWY1_9BACT|nr:hypothetical protein MBAV_001391 [Candidatus Magnetobacterium bavaricum]
MIRGATTAASRLRINTTTMTSRSVNPEEPREKGALCPLCHPSSDLHSNGSGKATRPQRNPFDLIILNPDAIKTFTKILTLRIFYHDSDIYYTVALFF